jgi:hypothetical protein
MVVLNDVGLTLEIIGFLIFLIIPIHKVVTRETFNLVTEQSSDPPPPTFMEKHPHLENLLRGICITLITFGLILQYSFLN